jgi:Yip1 domain
MTRPAIDRLGARAEEEETRAMDNALVQRMIGAARLDVRTYEEVERDTSATQQALIVVILASVASGLGALDDGGMGLVGGVIAGIVGWAVLAAICYFVGTRLLGTENTQADWGQLARTLGFAYTPNLLLILGFIPVVDILVAIVVFFWGIAATIIALRQALDFSTGRAVATAIISWIVSGIALAIVYAIFGISIGV